MIAVFGHGFHIVKIISLVESVHVCPRLVADAVVFVQFQIVYAAVIACQRRDHLFLPVLRYLLFQQLFLQGQPLFHLLALYPVLRLGGLLFQHQPGVLPVLADNKDEHCAQHQRRQHGLNYAAGYNTLGNRVNLLADGFFPHQVGQQPVCALHRHIAQRFPDSVVREGSDAPVPFFEIPSHLFQGIIFVILGMGQRLQQVILRCQSAQNRIGQGNAAGSVDVAEGGV